MGSTTSAYAGCPTSRRPVPPAGDVRPTPTTSSSGTGRMFAPTDRGPAPRLRRVAHDAFDPPGTHWLPVSPQLATVRRGLAAGVLGIPAVALAVVLFFTAGPLWAVL